VRLSFDNGHQTSAPYPREQWKHERVLLQLLCLLHVLLLLLLLVC
jgi:hypothetical protein